jgi:hypothetical protein
MPRQTKKPAETTAAAAKTARKPRAPKKMPAYLETVEEQQERAAAERKARIVAERTGLDNALLIGVDSGEIDASLRTHASTLAKLQLADGEEVGPFEALRIAEHTVGELSRRADQRWSDQATDRRAVDEWMHAYAAVRGWQYEQPKLSARRAAASSGARASGSMRACAGARRAVTRSIRFSKPASRCTKL